MKIAVTNYTHLLLKCIDKRSTPEEIASLYANAILQGRTYTSWTVVNRKIIAKWNLDTLMQIKSLAWKFALSREKSKNEVSRRIAKNLKNRK
jgi:hypothetical protein